MKTGTKKDREAVARKIQHAAKDSCPGVSVEITTLALSDRSLYVDIDTYAYGLKANIEIDPKSDREGYLIHWHGIRNPGVRLVPTFTDSVNTVHGGKATTFAPDLDTLLYKLEECLWDVTEGSAFEVMPS